MPFYMMKNEQKHLPEDAIEVGRIMGAWGIKGSMRVAPYSPEPEALFASKQWYLVAPEAKLTPARSKKTELARALPQGDSIKTSTVKPILPQVLTVKDIREQGDGIKVDALEVLDRDMAEALKGTRIFVSRSSFPELAEGEFYWIDLIGLQVINLQGELLGQVENLLNNGPQSVLQVAYATVDKHEQAVQAERLIPFVDAYVGEVDLEAGIIHVDWQTDY